MDAVSQIYKFPITSLIDGKRGQSNEARKVALWMVRECCDYTHEEIAEIFSLSGKTVGWACGEIIGHLKKKSRIYQRVKEVESRLGRAAGER